MNKITKLVSVLYDDFYPFDGLMGRMDCEVIANPGDLQTNSALIVWGGQDISPTLYGKKPSRYSGATEHVGRRDKIEWDCIHKAVEMGVPIIGICRGAQMLCAAAGGILMQHVDGHAGANHEISASNGQKYMVNSLHHQMMYPFEVDHELLAWSTDTMSGEYYDEDRILKKIKCEPELVIFPKLKGIAAQWHPEMMRANAPATAYLMEVINEKIESWL